MAEAGLDMENDEGDNNVIIYSDSVGYRIVERESLKEWGANLGEDNIPIRFKEEDGRIVLEINADFAVRVKGNLVHEAMGSNITYAGKDVVSVSGRFHHTNPAGGQFYDNNLADTGVDPGIRGLLDLKEYAYGKLAQEERRRNFYRQAARRNMLPRRKKKSGCGC